MVHSPYTPFFADAFMAGHVAIGVMLMILAWGWLKRAPVGRTLFFAAIAVVIVSPVLGEFLRSFGVKTLPLKITRDALVTSSCLVIVALVTMRRVGLVVLATFAAWVLSKCPDVFEDSMVEICALHLVWVGTALGLVQRKADEVLHADPIADVPRWHDVAIFAIATLAASLTSIFVTEHANASADEWAYTWMASVFAKGHLYGTVPPCESAFQSFYVFSWGGKLFSQYTPGWPLFMAPFVLVGVPWFAGPVSHGLMALGIARVARRAVRLDERGTSSTAAWAGWMAALVATFATTTLLLGASRWPHVFVAALFAWSIEAILVITTTKSAPAVQLKWGIALGSMIAVMGATRPADGATLSGGLAIYFVYALARRRIPLRALAGALVGFLFWGGLMLVILRAQLGEWFKTGYSLYSLIHTWDHVTYGWPKPNEWKFAMPLATGSYAWFPCSLAVGFAGLFALRKRAAGIMVMTLLGMIFFDAHYQYLNLARGFDWGYGPRYETPFIVPMAVGTGFALASLPHAARRFGSRSAFSVGGPIAVAIAMMLVTLVRLWPLLYPGIYTYCHQHDSLNQRIRDMGIHHAVVMTQVGSVGVDPLDLTENLPIDLYPNQDVLVAIDRKSDSAQCVRTNFPGRTFYHAAGNPVVITPY